MKIGVLALQGDFEKHFSMIRKAGAVPLKIRSIDDLEYIDGLIIPGGESTTIGKLLKRFNLLPHLKEKIGDGLPVFGTCAGMILLAREITGSDQLRIGAMDITVTRNAYGSQVDSFEADVNVPGISAEPVRAVFIRAPIVTDFSPEVKVLARFEDRPVLIRQDKLLASSFHPELTDNDAIHRYFLSMI
ncbi:MAG: pyridoxal 5'-phosphate synthase glutaminase subunit PdxT [Spirochaetales bacterium]|nr:pyridoxal 5'-phosphate synthase glutaminase subunit PdxT [Spirochaetales bacterium]